MDLDEDISLEPAVGVGYPYIDVHMNIKWYISDMVPVAAVMIFPRTRQIIENDITFKIAVLTFNNKL